MIGSVLGLLLAVFKAIPILKGIWDELIAEYIKYQYANMKSENAAAIKAAVGGDQRDLEKLINPDHAGEASHLHGTSIVDSVLNERKG